MNYDLILAIVVLAFALIMFSLRFFKRDQPEESDGYDETYGDNYPITHFPEDEDSE
jgi:hypothetical protein